MTLTNDIPPGAQLPPYVDYRLDLATPADPTPTRSGENLVYAQVYAADGAVLVRARQDGRPLGVTPGVERGRPVFQVPVTLPRGGSSTLTFDLLEPAAAGPARTWTTPLVKPAVVSADSFVCEAQNAR